MPRSAAYAFRGVGVMTAFLPAAEWLKGDVDAKVNGEAVEIREDEYGWLIVRRAWDVGDTIELNLPMGLTVSKAEYEADYGEEGVFAINYGPVTLAASMPNPLDDPADR